MYTDFTASREKASTKRSTVEVVNLSRQYRYLPNAGYETHIWYLDPSQNSAYC